MHPIVRPETDAVRPTLLDSRWFQVTVLPEVGCKIQGLVWKPSGRQVLWQNPRIRPRPYPIDSNFDNYWSGGWDDAFPTCDACEYGGEPYPNLGELRSVEWRQEVSERKDSHLTAVFEAFGPISPVRAAKIVTLCSGAPVLRMQYRIENLGATPLDFIWGTHPALAVTEDTVLRIPGKMGIVGQSSSPALGEAGQRYAWPFLEHARGTTDMSRVQPFAAGVFCGHYVTGLEAGWCAAENTRDGSGVLFTFPREICGNLWLWLDYGGWRGYHTVVMEPWTSCPVNLAQAVRQNTARRLEPRETFAVEIRATVYETPDTWREALRRVEDACSEGLY